MDYQALFGIASNLVLLPLLSLSLLIAYLNKKDYMRKAGFGKPEIGIIIVGSLFGLVADIPIIITGRSLLNINLGGALIPVIVCGSLIYKKKLNLILVAVGTALVSVAAYMITRIEPDLGIVADFPWFFVPSFGALAMAVILGMMSDDKEFFSIPYAYTIAVLGNLVGADILRIPELLDMGVLGSFGGAGAMDMVYLSGLIASVPLVFFYYRRHPITPSDDLLEQARNHLNDGNYMRSSELAFEGVIEEVKKASKLLKKKGVKFTSGPISTTSILYGLGFSRYAVRDYLTLAKNRGKNASHYGEARKNFLTGMLLRERIRKSVNDFYSALFRRILAYVIDLILLGTPFILLFFMFAYETMTGDPSELFTMPIMLAIVSLAISIQFLYFTIFEWYFGTTLGKSVFGLRVFDDDIHRMSFIQSAARNSGRYADMLLVFYAVSILLMLKSPEQKRIGDYIAGTRVVKIK